MPVARGHRQIRSNSASRIVAVMAHRQALSRKSFVDFVGIEHPVPTPRLSRTPGQVRSRAPRRGEHSVEVLLEWGLYRDQIAGAVETGAIGIYRNDDDTE